MQEDPNAWPDDALDGLLSAAARSGAAKPSTAMAEPERAGTQGVAGGPSVPSMPSQVGLLDLRRGRQRVAVWASVAALAAGVALAFLPGLRGEQKPLGYRISQVTGAVATVRGGDAQPRRLDLTPNSRISIRLQPKHARTAPAVVAFMRCGDKVRRLSPRVRTTAQGGVEVSSDAHEWFSTGDDIQCSLWIGLAEPGEPSVPPPHAVTDAQGVQWLALDVSYRDPIKEGP